MDKRLSSFFRHVSYNLRGGFILRPLIIALILGTIGGVLSWLEEAVPSIDNWVPLALFPSHNDPQVAQVILGGIASSVMTVVSIVFAILLMTLTLASMQFSPRIIVSFTRDRATQWTLGIFLGTFSYCMAALPAAHSQPHPAAPVAAVLGAMLLAVTCGGWLLFFIHHISQAISPSHIVNRIASETERVIERIMPRLRTGDSAFLVEEEASAVWESTILNDTSGYIRYIDTARLVHLAKTDRSKVKVVRRVGSFVPSGTPLLMVHRGDHLLQESITQFRGCIDLGPARTLEQDVECGVLQIVDIALKAISPAVNDPSTAIACIDHLSRILIAFASRELPESVLYDPPGVVRVSMRWIDFEQLLDSAFEQIRLYAKADVAVSLRLLRALGDIATTVSDTVRHQVLYQRGARIVEGCSTRLSEEELKPLGVRLAILQTLTEDNGTG